MRKIVNRINTGIDIREYVISGDILTIKVDVGDIQDGQLVDKLPVNNSNGKEDLSLVFKFGKVEADRVNGASNKNEECLDIINEKLFPLENL